MVLTWLLRYVQSNKNMPTYIRDHDDTSLNCSSAHQYVELAEDLKLAEDLTSDGMSVLQ